MREVPAAVVTIVGHTDSIGKADYNVALSKKRAQAAYDLILGGGIRARDGIRHDGQGPAVAEEGLHCVLVHQCGGSPCASDNLRVRVRFEKGSQLIRRWRRNIPSPRLARPRLMASHDAAQLLVAGHAGAQEVQHLAEGRVLAPPALV